MRKLTKKEIDARWPLRKTQPVLAYNAASIIITRQVMIEWLQIIRDAILIEEASQ
jgi:hypothetical protein